MVEHRKRYKRQNPVVCGQWGALRWSDGRSFEEMSNGRQLGSEHAICEYARRHRRCWKDAGVRPGGRGGGLGEYVERIVARIYGLWRMRWGFCTRLLGCILANGRDGESGGGGDGNVVLQGGREVARGGTREGLTGLQGRPERVCVGADGGGYHGGWAVRAGGYGAI